MKLDAIRKAAREGAFATKTIQCSGCFSDVKVSADTIAASMCNRCPEMNGFRRVNGARKCSDPKCSDPTDYVKEKNAEIGFCHKHACERSRETLRKWTFLEKVQCPCSRNWMREKGDSEIRCKVCRR